MPWSVCPQELAPLHKDSATDRNSAIYILQVTCNSTSMGHCSTVMADHPRCQATAKGGCHACMQARACLLHDFLPLQGFARGGQVAEARSLGQQRRRQGLVAVPHQRRPALWAPVPVLRGAQALLRHRAGEQELLQIKALAGPLLQDHAWRMQFLTQGLHPSRPFPGNMHAPAWLCWPWLQPSKGTRMKGPIRRSGLGQVNISH